MSSSTALLSDAFRAIAPEGGSDDIIRERMLVWELLRFCFGGATHPLPLGEHFTEGGGVIRDCYRPTVESIVKYLLDTDSLPSQVRTKLPQVEALLLT